MYVSEKYHVSMWGPQYSVLHRDVARWHAARTMQGTVNRAGNSDTLDAKAPTRQGKALEVSVRSFTCGGGRASRVIRLKHFC